MLNATTRARCFAQTRKKKRVLVLLPVLAVMVACDTPTPPPMSTDAQSIQQNKAFDTTQTEEASNGDDEEQLVVDTEDGIRVGHNLKLPDDFPADVATYPEMKVLTTSPVPDGYSIHAEVGVALESVATHLADDMQQSGWQQQPETVATDEMKTLIFAKDQRLVSYSLLRGDSITAIQINASGDAPQVVE